jgi:hypothetical protein
MALVFRRPVDWLSVSRFCPSIDIHQASFNLETMSVATLGNLWFSKISGSFSQVSKTARPYQQDGDTMALPFRDVTLLISSSFATLRLSKNRRSYFVGLTYLHAQSPFAAVMRSFNLIDGSDFRQV